MRILWLKSDLLLPLDKGGKLRTWHLMRPLARRHEITYLGFAHRRQPRGDMDGMREVAAHVVTVPRSDPRKGSLRFYADAVRHVLHPLPYAVAKYRSRRFAATVRRLLEEKTFDLIVCDFLFPAVNLPRRLPCPAVIFTHNVESEIWRRHTELRTRRLERALYRSQYLRMLRYEGDALRRFDGVLAVSNTDRDTFTRLYPGAFRGPVHIVRTGVDVEYFQAERSDPQSKHLIFTGSMDWLPNEDAMLFFCNDVWPLIRAEVPEATLSIVGRDPTPAVTRLAGPGINVTGRVDDIRPHVKEAAAYVVPLRIGGGTRLKIFEAMAMGKAVVSTTLGAEGLPVTNGCDVIIADGPQTFARSVVRLLRDARRRRDLELAARKLVAERHDWSVIAGELERVLLSFASQKSPSCEFRSLA